MQDKNQQQGDSQQQDAIARVLKIVGRRERLPEPTKQKWASGFQQQLEQVVARRRKLRQRRWTVLSACASLALFSIYLTFIGLPGAKGEAIAHIVRVVGESVSVTDDGEVSALNAGHKVHAQSRLQTPSAGYLALDYGGAQIRLDENTRIQIFSDHIRLNAGQLYVDTDSSQQQSAANRQGVNIRTSLASVTDIGTQFMVSYDASGLTTAVRDGAILVQVDKGEYSAHAGAEFAQSISISANNEVSVTRSDKAGGEWDWTMQLATEFTVEGRTAYEFLEWAARETGRHLSFDNELAESSARRTILHGDISGFDPDIAIKLVLETTKLVAQRPDANTIKVYLSAD